MLDFITQNSIYVVAIVVMIADAVTLYYYARM